MGILRQWPCSWMEWPQPEVNQGYSREKFILNLLPNTFLLYWICLNSNTPHLICYYEKTQNHFASRNCMQVHWDFFVIKFHHVIQSSCPRAKERGEEGTGRVTTKAQR